MPEMLLSHLWTWISQNWYVFCNYDLTLLLHHLTPFHPLSRNLQICHQLIWCKGWGWVLLCFVGLFHEKLGNGKLPNWEIPPSLLHRFWPMEADCHAFLIYLVYQFWFDVPRMWLDIVGISFPMSILLSEMCGMLITNWVRPGILHKKAWFNKKLI